MYFFLLPKSHKGLLIVPGRHVTFICGTPTEHATVFLGYHLKPPIADTIF